MDISDKPNKLKSLEMAKKRSKKVYTRFNKKFSKFGSVYGNINFFGEVQ